jgi:hypothetical protein
MENEELKALLDTLVGKTIAKWEFVDKPSWGDDEPYPGQGVSLHFTDGTEFTVYETQTAGEVCYKFGSKTND